jgi:Rieske Fe-S protein
METRRRFLQMVGTGAAVAAGCSEDDPELGTGGSASVGGMGGQGGTAGLGGTGGTGPMLEPVGDLSQLVEGDIVGIPVVQLFLGLDAGGVYAMTSLCSHSRCDLIVKSMVIPGNGRRCTCHSSRFDVNGQVLMGPATMDLAHFHVELDGTTILVDQSMLVDSSVRVPLPAGSGGGGTGGAAGGAGGSAGGAGGSAGGAGGSG